MAPKPEGFNLAGYVVPGAAILAVGGIVAWIIRRRLRRSAENALDQALAPVPGPGVTDAEMERSEPGTGGDGKVIWLEALAAALVGLALLLVVLGPAHLSRSGAGDRRR